LALCALSAFVNIEIAPRCRVAYKKLIDIARAEFTGAQLPEGRVIKDFPGYIFYIGKNRRGILQDVIIYDAAKGFTLHAARGRVEVDAPNEAVNLYLYELRGLELAKGQPGTSGEMLMQIPLKSKEKGNERPRISDMTFLQLCDELRQLERGM